MTFLIIRAGFFKMSFYDVSSFINECIPNQEHSTHERSESPEIVFIKEEKASGGKSEKERASSQLRVVPTDGSTDDEDDDSDSQGLSFQSTIRNPFNGHLEDPIT